MRNQQQVKETLQKAQWPIFFCSICERPWLKGGNGLFFSAAVVRDLGSKAGMANLFLREL